MTAARRQARPRPASTVSTITVFACGICGARYDDRADAERCQAKGLDDPIASVGDIVLGGAGFGWFDGDPAWVSNPDITLKTTGARCPKGDRNCFDDCCTYRFYYVVSHIDTDDTGHRRRYHLTTDAMKKAYRCGYTFPLHHIAPEVVNDPPAAVVKRAKALVGTKAGHLL